METKELRIGSIIGIKRVPKDFGIKSGWIIINERIMMMHLTYETIQKATYPIQINEEWLLKLGFSDEAGQKTLGRFSYDPQQRRFEIEGFEYDFNGITVELRYVHELQNLYFAFTQSELELKE